jgi:acyl carrier protein
MSIAIEVERFIVREIAAGRGIDAVAHDRDVLADGIIDSLGITELIAFLEDKYAIEVGDEDIDAENFRTIDDIVAFVTRKGG